VDVEPAVKPLNARIAAVLLLAVGVGVVAALRIDWRGERGGGLPPIFDYQVRSAPIDPALLRYRPAGELRLGLAEPRAIAVGPGDALYVAGDQTVQVFEAGWPAGARPARQVALAGPPRCLAVAPASHAFPGRLYVGLRDHVEVFDPQLKRLAVWESWGERAVLTSLALAEHDVLAADAGNRVVLRLDPSGKLLGRIGRPDPSRRIPGLVLPSPYCDVAVGSDELLRVANTGCHRIEVYTLEGELECSWGQPASGVEGFCGCCNPVHFAILPDGRVATAEKGIPRVKVYSADGKLEAVVAGPEVFEEGIGDRGQGTGVRSLDSVPASRSPVAAVAADSRGRVLILDPHRRCVRVFAPKDEPDKVTR
jgi:hypothetical protein